MGNNNSPRKTQNDFAQRVSYNGIQIKFTDVDKTDLQYLIKMINFIVHADFAQTCTKTWKMVLMKDQDILLIWYSY